jgi:hypothetical protein
LNAALEPPDSFAAAAIIALWIAFANSAIRLDDQRPRKHPAKIHGTRPELRIPTAQLKRE